MQFKHVVTCFLQSDQRILLLHRSDRVGSYRGKWAGVSGYLEEGEEPSERAKIEIEEEVGLSSAQARLIREGEPLRIFDEQKANVWIVHPFLVEVYGHELHLDWEHTESRWIDQDDLSSYDTVPGLNEALTRVRWDLTTIFSKLPNASRSVNDLAKDRVHGASILGRNAIQVLAEVGGSSTAHSVNELFGGLLAVALELRKAQPSMATIRNLVGKFLYDVEVAKQTVSTVEEFRDSVLSVARKAQADAKSAAEDSSRNATSIVPEEGFVLTHSYSNTVRRALELAAKSSPNLIVYVTESSPGLEGKQLAKDLIELGVQVRLIADSAVGSVISDVDTVLVGADSVLANGSVINKIGTKRIALIAEQEEIPVNTVCESTKFSTMDFLGEPVLIDETLFDVTPTQYVSSIITESDSFEPQRIEQEIAKLVRQLYP